VLVLLVYAVDSMRVGMRDPFARESRLEFPMTAFTRFDELAVSGDQRLAVLVGALHAATRHAVARSALNEWRVVILIDGLRSSRTLKEC
jgi:hypothetical protein